MSRKINIAACIKFAHYVSWLHKSLRNPEKMCSFGILLLFECESLTAAAVFFYLYTGLKGRNQFAKGQQ